MAHEDIQDAVEAHGYDSAIPPLMNELRAFREMDPHNCVPLTTHNRAISEMQEQLNESHDRRAKLYQELMEAQQLNKHYRDQLDKREHTPFENWFQHIHPELFKTITVEFK